MAKNLHEIRDPIHVFVRLDSDERRVLDSRPLQRLRQIHQLAMSYLVYPGATHKRFEHSLGVMDLAGRVFDVVTRQDALTDEVRQALPELMNSSQLDYWRRVLRMAALCHDIGHLPFSHAAEKDLLPTGWSHERLTREIVLSDEMKEYWDSITPPLRPVDVVKLAIGPRKAPDIRFSAWEALLSEIIVGDALGVDRMDYLLRDSHHAGVAYGRFDYSRLIDTLRILLAPATGEPTLGIEEGGIQSAEALLLARYFMYSQVYFHQVRRIYDIHLQDFLASWLPGGKFPTELEGHLCMTDNEVNAALFAAARDSARPGHDAAKRITSRRHFRVLYQRTPMDVQINPDAAQAVCEAAKVKFGPENIRYDQYRQEGGAADFPVKLRDEGVLSALSLSDVLNHLPVVAIDYVFVAPEVRAEAEDWLAKTRSTVIQPNTEVET